MIGFLVLAITLSSLLAAGLPLLTAIVGVATGLIGLQAFTDVFEISETAPILATMLGLAVGIDYALFILTRYRQNLSEGKDGRDAAAHATATAGSAVVFAGATVVIALVGLLVVNIPFLTVMGMAAAGTVSIAVLIALTLLPAILGFAGHRVARSNRVVSWRPRRRAPGKDTMSVRWAKLVTRRPLAVVAVSVAMLGVIAIPATHMELGLPDAGSDPAESTERKAYDLLTEGFGPGFNGPLTIVVDAPNLPADEQKQVAGAVAEGLEDFDGVAAVSPPTQNEAGDLTVVSVTPTSGPTTEETRDLVTELRAKADEVNAESGIDAYVTGQTAINIDTADRLNASLVKYMLVVVGLALLLLTIVFRSILVPVKAALGFLLSIGASLGLVVWVFQDGNLAGLFGVAKPGPILSFLPILLIGILFGLAMDYEVFLVSRMRERFLKTGRAKESVISGYGESGRVVTAAAIIMTGVFAAFILSPDPITKSIGLSLAFGVLADAFIVRMTIVPAVMVMLGERAWRLPRRLGRLCPTSTSRARGWRRRLSRARRRACGATRGPGGVRRRARRAPPPPRAACPRGGRRPRWRRSPRSAGRGRSRSRRRRATGRRRWRRDRRARGVGGRRGPSAANEPLTLLRTCSASSRSPRAISRRASGTAASARPGSSSSARRRPVSSPSCTSASASEGTRPSKKLSTWAGGTAPTNSSTTLPSLNALTAGMPWIWKAAARLWLASVSSLASATWPSRALVAFSSTGVSWRQGPHHAAQKSTTTGSSRERSRTSCSKVASVVSKITPPRIVSARGRPGDRGGGGGAPGRAPARADRDAPLRRHGIEGARARRQSGDRLRRARARAV